MKQDGDIYLNSQQNKFKKSDIDIIPYWCNVIFNFTFNNFKDALEFINKVGVIAEEEVHHPDLWFGWGYARIKIYTHAIKGLAESDFILAAKIDKIINVWSALFLKKVELY